MSVEPAQSIGQKFENLVRIMAQLRAPGGCPWDREQTFDSIKPYTLEETYEVLDAIDARDWEGLREELGDFTLQAVFYAQMAQEDGRFSIADSLDAINEKLIRRHPHVFGNGEAKTPDQVKARWDEIKQTEKKDQPQSLLGGVSRSQPSLAESQQLTHKAAGVGFDWPSPDQVLEKLHEELAELESATSTAAKAEEIGDLLFVLVNLARKLGIDAEQSLRASNAKFRRRFAYIEENLGKPWSDTNLEEMDRLWNEAKAKLKSGS
jgi:MazG family protein